MSIVTSAKVWNAFVREYGGLGGPRGILFRAKRLIEDVPKVLSGHLKKPASPSNMYAVILLLAAYFLQNDLAGDLAWDNADMRGEIETRMKALEDIIALKLSHEIELEAALDFLEMDADMRKRLHEDALTIADVLAEKPNLLFRIKISFE